MIRDAQVVLDSANALSATSNSQNVVDHSSLGNLGIGEPLALLITIGVLGTNTGSFRLRWSAPITSVFGERSNIGDGEVGRHPGSQHQVRWWAAAFG